MNDEQTNSDEADFRPVPLSQLYNHHYAATDLLAPKLSDQETYAEWVKAQDKSFSNGPCNLGIPFGGGSEMPSAPIIFQEPYVSLHH